MDTDSAFIVSEEYLASDLTCRVENLLKAVCQKSSAKDLAWSGTDKKCREQGNCNYN